MSQFENYIQKSYKKTKQYKVFDIPIVIKDEFIEDIDLDLTVRQIEKMIPKNLLTGLDVIYVGEFEELESKEVTALYLDGAIYVTNLQSSEKDLLDDIVHECAHFVEEKYTDIIYGNSNIEREFLKKRDILFDMLRDKGYEIPVQFRHTLEYNKTIDDFFYKLIGYPVLRDMIGGLFLSAYSVTDVREYFAISFENYFLGNKNDVREVTPNVYIVLEELLGE